MFGGKAIMERSGKVVKYLRADNFVLTGSIQEQENFKSNLPEGVLFDERTNLICFDNQLSAVDFTWYKNYINTIAQLRVKLNRGSYIDSYLSIGYIPAVYLPIIDVPNIVNFGRAMIDTLDALGIPHINMHPSSFVKNKVLQVGIDVYVNKMDLYEILGKSPETITSCDVIDLIAKNLNG